MLITSGRVNGGRIELTDDTLPEGTTVTILAPENGETFAVSAEEETRLLAAIAEAERGEVLDGSEVIKQISRT
jgi:hypothetical protein